MTSNKKIRGVLQTFTTFVLGVTHCDRKLGQIIHLESGSSYELFKSHDGSLSIWQTDMDGICTIWDGGDEEHLIQKLGLSDCFI